VERLDPHNVLDGLTPMQIRQSRNANRDTMFPLQWSGDPSEILNSTIIVYTVDRNKNVHLHLNKLC